MGPSLACRWGFVTPRADPPSATICLFCRARTLPKRAITAYQGRSRFGFYITACIYLAVGAGEITLASSDPHEQPVLDYNYLAESFDRDRLREAVRMVVEFAEHEAYEEIVAERVAPTDDSLTTNAALDEWMMREVSTSHHSSSTCKMGQGLDPMAVVDQYGKVHGIEGLRVADASIMPDCIRANTNVTTMVIGERVG